jgi:hypothetical protein
VTQEELEQAAQLYEAAAAELDRAIGHCQVAAEHFRRVQQPNALAHAWAARGHLLKAAALLDEQAVQHTGKAQLPAD